MTEKQEAETPENSCAFHLLFDLTVQLRPNGDCPLCVEAPSDEEQLQGHADDDDEDYGCWPEDPLGT